MVIVEITFIGTGYVGLVSGVCFAELGHIVTCVDIDQPKIDMLNKGEIPIYELGLKELIDVNRGRGTLKFTADITNSFKNAEIIFICVGTPSLPNGEANLRYIEQAAKDIAMNMNGYKIIVTKSTVPVGTNDRIKAIVGRFTQFPFDIVSMPEFLREGSAIQDTLSPDRIVIGSESEYAIAVLTKLHSPLTTNIMVTDIRSAEMIKYASNAYLATKISFINEIANICEKVGADVTQVAKGMGFDRRIGASFLRAGIGYGGSCFPKDTHALIQIAGNVDYEFKLLKSVVEVNKDQRFNVINKLKHSLGEDLTGKTIGIWGLAFKPNTDDIRDAPAIDIIHTLLMDGALVKVYDPVAMPNFKKIFADFPSIEWCDSPLMTAQRCDAICLLTEWPEFRDQELLAVQRVMNQPILIDGRNVFSKEQMEQTLFQYYSVGRPHVGSLSQYREKARASKT